MTRLAPTLQAFFTHRLITQRNASPHTIASYRDTFRLLLAFAQHHTGKPPFQLDFDDLDAPLIGAFLTHLEHDRHNSARTRNNRLAAIHSLYRYAALQHPEHAATIARVMAIPTKRYQRNEISYLDLSEIKALLQAPDRTRWLGRRDHTLMLLAIQTGLRVSELTSLRVRDVSLTPRSRASHRQRPQNALDHPHPRNRHGPTPMAHRTPRPARRPALPHQPRTTTQPRRHRTAAHQTRRHRRHHLPVTHRQARHRTRAQTHQRDAPTSQRRRHRDHRSLARP